MTIGPDQVRRVAQLAALEVAPEDLERVARELDRIVGYVDQLQQLVDGRSDPPTIGPGAAVLRPDQVTPPDLAGPPAALAPEFRDGFFLVPRLEAMGE